MSTWHRSVQFRHSNPCQMGGCDGHTMELVYDCSDDIAEFMVDGVHLIYFDEGVVDAIATLWKGGENASS